MDLNKKCVWIGIGVKIHKEAKLCYECREMSQFLYEKYENLIMFSKTNEPHLNIHDLDVPKDNLNLIADKIRTIISNQTVFEVKIKQINYFTFGVFFIELENNENLQRLHKDIVKSVSLLKEKCVCEDYLKPKRIYTLEQKAMLKQYGNPHVIKQFKPHITSGLTKKKNIDSIKKELALR